MRNILLALTLLLSTNSYGNNQSELWVWKNNSNKHTFSINLSESNTGFVGTYCAIGMSGRRTDCSYKSNKNEFYFSLENNEFEFRTNYSNTTGIAKITIEGNHLKWRIIKKPKGEHYAPQEATLIRHKSHNKQQWWIQKDKQY